jgi:hypothetical protein
MDNLIDRRSFIVFSVSVVTGFREALAGGHNAFCNFRDEGGGYIKEKQIVIHGSDYENFRVQALASSQPQTVLVEDQAGYATALRDVRSGRLPPGSVAVFDRSRNPESVIAGIGEKVGRVSVYFNVPETLNEAINIHGQRDFQLGLPNSQLESYLSAFKLIAARYRSMKAIKIEGHGGFNAAEWLQNEIDKHSSEDLVIIASHVNIYNTIMIAPDGSPAFYKAGRLPLNDGSLFNLINVRSSGPTVWTVGCQTWISMAGEIDLRSTEVAFTTKITYPDSILVVQEVKEGLTIQERINRLQQKRWAPQQLERSRRTTRQPTGPTPTPDLNDNHPLPGVESPVTFVAEVVGDKAIMTTDKMEV